MTCDDHQEKVSQFLDSELPVDEERQLFRHLGECDSCRRFLATVVRMRHTLLCVRPVRVDERVDRALERRLRTGGASMPERPPRRLWRGKVSVRLPVAAVLAALLIAASMFVGTMITPAHRPTSAERVVYVRTLPTVDVVGHRPSESDNVKGRRQ